jgi:uncharacterized Zn finger protein
MPPMTEKRWSSDFITMLEALRMPAQFQAGRRYLRAGHVRSLTISSSLAVAVVWDDDGQTYRTRVAVRAFGQADWRRIERALAEQAIHAARLLSGRLPDDLDRVVASFGLSLFPVELQELAMDCTCTTWQVPCRHLTATFYALADSFDQDPFGILTWRGRGREELLDHLRVLRSQPEPENNQATVEKPRGFWTAGPRLALPPQGPHGRPDAVLDLLEPLDLTAGRYQVTDLLRRAYRVMASEAGAEAAEDTVD